MGIVAQRPTQDNHFRLPKRLVPDAARTAEEAREALIMKRLREGQISQGYAADLLGLTRWEMMQLMGEYRLSVFAEQTEEELREEVDEARRELEGSLP
jgi:predicted HTH domain antitoxin